MKTLKLVMIATLVSLVMVSFASQDPDTPKKKISLDFQQAIQNPIVLTAMYEQLDYSFLNVNWKTYTVEVLVRNYTVSITGTQSQWVSFFMNVLTDPVLLDLRFDD